MRTGAREVETPAFDSLAAGGVLFEQAVSVAPLTLPAHSSIFTGKFPPEHGVRDNGGFFLGAEQVTLAEVLKARGYQTGAFVGAYVLDAKWGTDQGFDAYVDEFDLSQTRAVSLSAIQRPANEVVDKALPWLAAHAAAPFFAWVHLYDAHAPYRPPEPFLTRYADHPVQRRNRLCRLPGWPPALAATRRRSGGSHGRGGHGRSRREPWRSWRKRTWLLRLRQRDACAVRHPRAIQPDHGPPGCRPGSLGGRDADGSGSPGVPLPQPVSGVSLVPLMTGARTELALDAYSEAMYPLHHYGWSDLRALRSGRYKVIDAPRPELFDVERDPPRDDQPVWRPAAPG